VEGGELLDGGEGDKEVTGEIETDEARAEERDETWEERRLRISSNSQSIAEYESFLHPTASKRCKKKKKVKVPVMKDRGKLKYFQALPLDLAGEVSLRKQSISSWQQC